MALPGQSSMSDFVSEDSFLDIMKRRLPPTVVNCLLAAGKSIFSTKFIVTGARVSVSSHATIDTVIEGKIYNATKLIR